jgi:hypothetical protein
VVTAAAATFVKVHEESTLTKTFGEQYERYRRNVPGWWPRLWPRRGRLLWPTDVGKQMLYGRGE